MNIFKLSILLLINLFFVNAQENCKKIWNMENNINNIPIYKISLKLCIESNFYDNSLLDSLLEKNIKTIQNQLDNGEDSTQTTVDSEPIKNTIHLQNNTNFTDTNSTYLNYTSNFSNISYINTTNYSTTNIHTIYNKSNITDYLNINGSNINASNISLITNDIINILTNKTKNETVNETQNTKKNTTIKKINDTDNNVNDNINNNKTLNLNNTQDLITEKKALPKEPQTIIVEKDNNILITVVICLSFLLTLLVGFMIVKHYKNNKIDCSINAKKSKVIKANSNLFNKNDVNDNSNNNNKSIGAENKVINATNKVIKPINNMKTNISKSKNLNKPVKKEVDQKVNKDVMVNNPGLERLNKLRHYSKVNGAMKRGRVNLKKKSFGQRKHHIIDINSDSNKNYRLSRDPPPGMTPKPNPLNASVNKTHGPNTPPSKPRPPPIRSSVISNKESPRANTLNESEDMEII